LKDQWINGVVAEKIRLIPDSEVCHVSFVILPNVPCSRSIICHEGRDGFGSGVEQPHRVNDICSGGLGEAKKIVNSQVTIAACTDDALGVHRTSADAEVLDTEILK